MPSKIVVSVSDGLFLNLTSLASDNGMKVSELVRVLVLSHPAYKSSYPSIFSTDGQFPLPFCSPDKKEIE